jgi:hypothetical protein
MNNNDWQLQQQLHQQQQRQFFWDCCILANQWQTNKELQRLGELQQQNNALLEQIRRMQLTPAQRAAEDQQRARLKIFTRCRGPAGSRARTYSLFFDTLLPHHGDWFHRHRLGLTGAPSGASHSGASANHSHSQT